MADDLQQALAHVGQPVIGRAGAHGLGGFRLDDLPGVADLGAGDAALGGDPDRAVVGGVCLVALLLQMVGPVLGDGVLAVVDKDKLRFFIKGAESGFQPVLVGVTRKPAQLRNAGPDLHRLAKELDLLRTVDQRVA